MRRGTKPRWQTQPPRQPANDHERAQQQTCRGKKSFASKRSAKLYCTRASIFLRPYKCDWCGEWHATGQKADGTRG